MITDLEADILECKVKWALGSITKNKASGGDGIPVELFQILKDISLKHSLEGHLIPRTDSLEKILMLRLKLQYFGPLMHRTDSLEKT